MKTHRDKIINLILAVVPIAFIFIVWQIEAKKLNNEFILPNLGKTVGALLALFKEQVFYRSLLGTLWRTVLAFGFSFGVATVLAFISRISKRAEVMISPLVSVTRSLPTIAIVLLLLIWTKDNKNLSAMIATICYLWESDPEFRRKFNKQPWFCLPHYRAMLEYASKKMPKKVYNDFYDEAHAIEKKYITELKGDVSWFCKKFDYRYDEEPWYNSKDSVERSMKFLRSDIHKQEKGK
jgi:hypothetical protein